MTYQEYLKALDETPDGAARRTLRRQAFTLKRKVDRAVALGLAREIAERKSGRWLDTFTQAGLSEIAEQLLDQ